MASFQPTHRITTDRETVEVMVTDNGAAYQRHEWDATVDSDYERGGDGQWLFQGEPLAGTVEAITPREYRIALVKADGSWDVIETFEAADDDAANAYAEQNHADSDWYVLDADGRNINGGRDQ